MSAPCRLTLAIAEELSGIAVSRFGPKAEVGSTYLQMVLLLLRQPRLAQAFDGDWKHIVLLEHLE